MPFGLNHSSDWYSLFEKNGYLDPLRVMENRLLTWRQNQEIYPPQEQVLQVFKKCDFNQVRVVLIGQDPYHGEGQANGMAFSVARGVGIPPSLKNIYKELISEGLMTEAPHGDLTHWVEQGVFLINTCLTVEANKPLSHAGLGWETFTSKCIEWLASYRKDLVFLLWGSKAREFKRVITPNNGHCLLEAPHPSPLSAHRGFLGCGHFSKANDFLSSKQMTPIDWAIR